MNKLGFPLYLLFLFSWFTHLTSRIPVLGDIRFDLILISAIFILSTSKSKNSPNADSKTSWALSLLVFYVIFTIPFVEWPGSTLDNLQNWLKYIAFYYFTVTLVDSEKKLKIFLLVFLSLQIFRVAEPLYLHITEGYWGSAAFMANWEHMNRLAGAPHDFINPNGLAFVILTVFPFLFFFRSLSFLNQAICCLAISALIYALILTGSRSGMLAMGFCLAMIIYKSKRKLLASAIMIPVTLVVLFSLSGDLKDRYLSIFDPTTKNAGTAEGRLDGIKEDLELSLRRPVFGHGLGTSLEASAHFSGRDQLSHNLYTEIAIELGFAGFAIFMFYIGCMVVNIVKSSTILKDHNLHNDFISAFQKGLTAWFATNIIFSFASYGLSSYEWYLFGGMSVVLLRICNEYKTPIQNAPLIPAAVPIASR